MKGEGLTDHGRSAGSDTIRACVMTFRWAAFVGRASRAPCSVSGRHFPPTLHMRCIEKPCNVVIFIGDAELQSCWCGGWCGSMHVLALNSVLAYPQEN